MQTQLPEINVGLLSRRAKKPRTQHKQKHENITHAHAPTHSPAPAQVYLPWPGDPDFGGPQFPDHFPLLFLPPPSLCLNACPVLPLVRFWMPIKAQTLPRRPRPLQDPDGCPQGPFWEHFWMHQINTPWAPISFTFLSLFHGSILEWIYYNCYMMSGSLFKQPGFTY